VAGEHDDFIKKHHSEQIYEKYAGDKNLIIVEGDHNSPRPKFMFDSASIFLQTCLQIPNSWALPVPISMNLMCPPWFFEAYSRQRSVRQRHRQHDTEVAAAAAAARNNSTAVSHTASGPNSSATDSKMNNNNGFDHEEIGMTAERQRVIQASLFKMLGQADGPSSAQSSDAKPASKGTLSGESGGGDSNNAAI
jgi:hypothetical protein